MKTVGIIVLTSLLAAWELLRGLSAFIYGIRQEHVSSIGRGWRVAVNGFVLSALAIVEYLLFIKGA